MHSATRGGGWRSRPSARSCSFDRHPAPRSSGHPRTGSSHREVTLPGLTGRPRRGGDRDKRSSSSNSGLCFGEQFARHCARPRSFCASSPLIRNTPFTCAHTQYLSLHRRRPLPLGCVKRPHGRGSDKKGGAVAPRNAQFAARALEQRGLGPRRRFRPSDGADRKLGVPRVASQPRAQTAASKRQSSIDCVCCWGGTQTWSLVTRGRLD